MNHWKLRFPRMRRGISLLLVCVLLAGLFPPEIFAAEDTIKLTDCDFTGTSYHSAVLGNASIHTMQFDYNGGTTGFCGDHGKGMGRSLIGQTWGSRTEITDPTVKMLLAYYYCHTLGQFTDAAVAAGVNHVWSEEYTNYMNAWIQAVIWRYVQGQLNNPVEDAAEELMWVYNCLRNEHNTSIDDCASNSTISFRQSTQYIFDLGTETWGTADVYRYTFTGAGNATHPADTVQSVVIGNIHQDTVQPPTTDYSLTVKKVDADNPNLALSGAMFHIEKQGSSLSWDVTTGSDGTCTLRNLTAGTYAITETAAPSGYRIDNAGPDYVSLPSGGQTTVTKIFTDTVEQPPSGEIRKVDRDHSTRGLAGATIAIQGIDNSFFGEYQTGTGGALEGLDWADLPSGSYRAWETAAPEGYSLDSSDVKTFRIGGDTSHVQLVFHNDAKVKVRLMKLDESDNPLPGALFNVFHNGQIIATEVTNSAGQITVTDVEEGLYAFVEVSAPAGFAVTEHPAMVYVDQADIQGGGVITVTATDQRLPNLTIRKKDAATGAAIPNTTFEIRGVHSGYRMEITTGNDGSVTLKGIPVDYYEVTEKNVPAPYTLSDERTQTVWLGAGEHPTLVFNNLEEPELSILKIDAETSDPIPGVVFNVQGIDVDYEADWTTGDDGRYTTQVEPGSYRITEKSVPAPYSLSANNVRTVSLTAGAEREIVFENLKNPYLNLTKIDALDGRVIPGTVFQVTGIDNSYSSQWTTGTDGTASERLEPGTYRITEVSVPAPYYLPENEADRVQTISLRAGDVRSVVFKDYRTPTLTIYKLDAVSGAPVEGAQFHVTYTRVSNIPDAPATYDFGTLYSNADGQIPLHEAGVKLYPGQYTMEETAPAPGFQLREPTTQTVMINGSESRSVTFYNAPLNAIIVEKYDSVTGLAVPGATFRLRYLSGTSGTDGTVIGMKTTGESGSAIWTGLEAGTYIVEEISAPTGYNITRSTQTVYLAANGEQSVVTVSFDNTPNGGLLVRKIDAKTGLPMAGIEFLVTDSRGTFIGSGNGRFTTDDAGTILIGNVTPGTTLIIRETRTLPGYILDPTPQTAVIQEGRTTTLTFRNEPGGTIIIYKKDAVTGAALEGVQFKVTTSSGTVVDTADGMLSSNGIYYTDSNGQIVLGNLNPDTYLITETATISGYTLDATPHAVVVRAGDTQTVTIRNQPRGGLLMIKLDRTTRLPLANAQFRIVPANDALLIDNEGLTSANHLYTTDADGQIRLENLTPGAYIVTETTAPDGYALDSEAQTVTVVSGRIQTVTFHDTALTTLQILKRDAVSGQPLGGAEFTVTTADGTRLGDNNGIYTTGEDGTATVTGLQPNSAVIVSENTSPAGYVLNPTPQSIIVRSGAVNSLVFNDEPKTTLLVHKYIAGTRNEPLAGCEFKVTNSRGEVQGFNNGIYTTDRSGDFMVTGLDPGLTVTVRETRTVDGYVLDGTAQSIQILAGDTQELTFWNQRKGSLIIRKLADDTGLPLAGVEFNVTYADGRPVDNHNGGTSTNGRYVTDSRGEIVINDITGVIVVTETASIDGYAIDPASRSQTVVVNPEDAQTLTFTNPRLQTLILTKYQTGTTTPIPGVSYLLTDGDGAAIGNSGGEFTTDRNGQIIVTDLIPGTTVTAREISVPDEYILDTTPHTIRVRSGEAQTMTLYNSLKGSITIRKIDSATGEALPGAQFRVTTATGNAVSGYTGAVGSNGIFTTDRNGEITLNRLQPDVYTVREVQAPDGYVMDDQPRTVVLDAAETQTVTFANAPKGSLVIVKADSVTGTPLAGAAFRVTTADGTAAASSGGTISGNGSFVTDATGQIILTGLSPAAYVVTEVQAPEGYHLSADSQTVEVTTDDVQTIRFVDEPLAALTIRKTDAVTGAALRDAVFSVKDSEGRTIGAANGLYTTGADGTVTVSGLTPRSSIVVTEIQAPEGYVKDERPQTIQIRSGAANSLTFANQPTATVVIRKIAADTGEALSGVSFKVIDGSGANVGPDDGIFTTDHAGEIRVPGLTPGVTVKAREIEAAPGYVLDPIPQDVELLAGQVHTLTFRDVPKGALIIRKLDSATNQPLADVTFKITTATGDYVPDENGSLSANGLYRTDAAGEIILTGIVGTLVVTETETIPGYVINETTRSQTVMVHPADTQTLTFFNTPKQSLTVQKYAAGTTTPLANVEFLVSDSTGAVVGPANGVYTTDTNGRFVVTDLEPGITVTVKETKAPDGYILDSMPKSIVIRSGEAQSLTFENSPKGTLMLLKRDSLTDQPLPGAVFQVMTAGGQFVANAGGQLSGNGRYSSDSSGQVILTDLAPGVYVVREVEAPAGYVLDDTPQTVELFANETQTLTFRNVPTQKLIVQKYVTGTTTPLTGVEFYAADSFGTALGSDNGRFVTDENGRFEIDGLVPDTTVTVRETKTVDGYILDTTEKSIGIRSGEAQSLVFYNTPRGALRIVKRDAVTNQPLGGAVFQVTNSRGEYLVSHGGTPHSNGLYTTDNSGEILLTGLEPATLVVREAQAPAGYVLDDTPQTVELSANETRTLTFTNVPTQTVTIRKYAEGTTTPLQGVRFTVTDGGGVPIGAGEYVTNEAGEIVLSGIAPGTTVIARETKTIRGYALNGTPQNLIVRTGAENALTFYDSPLSTLIVQKYIAGTDNEPLSGVAFRITDGTGAVVGNTDGIHYTNDAGEIVIPDLEQGKTLTIRETRTVDGFVLDGTPKTVEIRNSDVHEVVCWNQRQGSLVVRKLDSLTHAPLAGAEFAIAYADGRSVDNGQQSSNGIYTTNSSGEIVINGVTGTLVVTERKAPNGYSMDPDSRSQTVTVHPNDGQTLVFYNDPDQTLTLQKYAEGTTTPIPGAVFRIQDSGGELLGNNGGEFTTDRNGQILLSGLTAGMTVTAREIRAADGYTLDATPHSIRIRRGEGQTLTVYNTPQRTLTVNKFVEGTTIPLQGVRFSVTDGTGAAIGAGEYVTNERGQIVIPNLDAGTTVTVREIATVRGYALNGCPQTVTISSERENVLNFYDTPLSTLIVRKYIAGTDNEPLSGVGFRITDGTGAAVGNTDGTHYTDEAGEIRLENLELGRTLIIREISTKPGFVLDGTPKTVEIRNSDVHEVVFYNSRQGSLIVRKLDSVTRQPIPGAEFHLFFADGRSVDTANGQISSNGVYLTDANGEITVTGITGTIVATEQRSAAGYVLNPDNRSQTVTVHPGETQTLLFRNTPKQTLIITKTASDTGTPLPGVAFAVTDADGAAVGADNGRFVTDADGRIVIQDLTPGDVITVRETQTVSGYVLDPVPQSIRIREGEAQTLSFFNSPKGSLTVVKTDSLTDEPLSGAEFRISTLLGEPLDDEEGQISTGGIYTTDANGRITLTKVQPGTYTVQETKAPAGYVADGTAQTVTVRANDAQTVTFRDTPLQTLVIEKVADGTSRPLAGVVFLLTDADGRPLGGGNGEYVTDDNGRIVVDGLAPGTVVVAREVRTIEGYHLNPTPQTIRITADGTASLLSQSGGGSRGTAGGNTLVFSDTPLSTLIIRKVIDGTENEPLPGVEFKVVDGSGANVGGTDGVFYTNAQGEIVITGLEAGTVIKARETQTVPGFVLDGTPKDIQIQSASVHELLFKNKRQGGLTIRKLDSLTDEPLAGAGFRVVYADGRPVDNLNGQQSSGGIYTTDASGEIHITGITGTIVVTEERAPEGYSVDAANRSQTVVVNPAETQTLTFRNAPDQNVIIQKYAKGTTTPIQGARFLVTDGDGRTVGENGGEFTTDEAGRITVTGLKPGVTITAREIEAAAGYVLDATPKSVTVRSGSVQQITFYNEPSGTLTIVKQDAATDAPLAGAVFQIANARGEFVDGIGTANGRHTTDGNGQIILTGLDPMTVVVKEVEAPEGYSLDDTPQTAEIVPGETRTLTFRDLPLQTLVITKYADGTTTPLAGVVFLVTDVGGNPVGSGEYVTDANGRIVISGLPVGTTVVAREIRTVRGYHLNGTPQTIQIGASGTAALLNADPSAGGTSSGTGGTNGGNAMNFYDAPLATLVVRKLIDGTENTPLPGVQFKIVDGTGKNIGESDGVFYTDENGEIVIQNLEIGTTVKVRETKTVDGFVLDGTPKDIEIVSNDLHELVFRNQRQGSLIIRARDSATQETLPDVVFRIVYADGRSVDNNGGQTSSNGIYTTDTSGEIHITGITGTIVVTELRTIEGYTLNPAGSQQTVIVNPAETQTLTFEDAPNQTLTVQVLASDTGEPLAGVQLLVTDSEGTVIGPANGEYVTDQNGRITITNLIPGVTVTVKETAVTDGYILNGNPQSIEIRGGEAQSLTFRNHPRGTLVLLARDRVTDQPVPDVTFQIVDSTGSFVGDYGGALTGNGLYTSDENGQVILHRLEPAVLVIRETEVPAGYILNTDPQTVEIDPADMQTLIFKNTPTQTVVVQTFVQGTTEPLTGVRFLITDGSGRNIGAGEYTTDENGRIVLSGISPGTTVIAREIRTVSGYTLNGTPKTLEVVSGQENVLTFYADPLSTLMIHCYVDGTENEPLSNVGFRIVDGREQPIGANDGIYYTDHTGSITIPNLEPGVTLNARIFKIADGFVLDGLPQEIVIESGAVQELTFWAKRQGSLTVWARDSLTHEGIPGVAFTVAYADGRPVDDGQQSGNGRYSTGEDGAFRVTGITGAVVVTEVQTVSGYSINAASATRTVTVNPGETQTLTFTDTPDQTLTIRLYEKGTTAPIPGAVFLLRDSGGALVGADNGRYTTNASGEFTVTGLTPGVTITATQTATVSGYVLDTAPQSILIQSGEAQTLVFENARKGMLTIVKRDAVTDGPLQGAEFRITTVQGIPVDDHEGTTSTSGIYTTDANGEITLFKLDPGIYTVTETKAPDGYAIDRTPQTVEVRENDSQTLTFRDNPLQALTLYKYESGTTNPIAGVTFSVTDANGNPVGAGTYTTDASGQITIPGLTPGMTVIVRETRTVRGYVLNGEPQTIQISADGTAGTVSGNTLVFYDEPLSTLLIHIYVDGTENEPLSNVGFRIVDGSGGGLGPDGGTFYSDNAGTVTLTGLEPGVTVNARVFKIADGFVLDGLPQEIVMESGSVQELTFWAKRQGTLTVRVLDSLTREPVPGVQFSVKYADGRPVDTANGQQSSGGQYFTDTNGEFSVTGITGTVVVTEERTAQGYTMDANDRTKTVEVNPAETQTLLFTNTPLQTLTIRNVSAETAEPLAESVFLVTDSSGAGVGQDNGTFTTDRDGRFVISGLAPGVTITARQTSVNDRYTLDTMPQSILIRSGEAQSLIFANSLKGTLSIRLLNSVTEDPLSGGEFRVSGMQGTFRTGEEGQIEIDRVQSGTYTVTQIKAPEGFVADHTPQTVEVQSGDHQTIVFRNDPLQSLTVQLYARGTTDPIPGARFLLTDGTGAKLGNEDGEFPTDENGRFTVSGIAPGVTVSVKQISTADGFLFNASPRTIPIRSGEAQSVTVYNDPTQTLIVRLYEKGTTTPIPGVVFTVRDSGGALVGADNGRFTTNASGEFTVTGLTPGVTITATQTATVSGYVLDTAPQSILIRSGEAQTLVFENARKGMLTIVKRDAVTDEPLQGAEFRITTVQGIPVDDNEGATSSNGLYTTDAQGEIVIAKLLPGIYTVTETKAPDGYAIDRTPQTVEVRENDSQTLTFRDEPLQALTLYKYESGTTNPIAGVAFSVTDANGNPVGSGTYTTDANGQITIPGLTPGMTVIVRETRTVRGYVLNGEPQTIVIGNGGNILTSGTAGTGNTLVFYDEPLSTLLIHIYVDGTENEPLANVGFRIVDGSKRGLGPDGGTFYSDNAGMVTLNNLEPGVTVNARVFKIADGFVLDGLPQEIVMESGAVQELTFWAKRQGSLTVWARDSLTHEGIPGVTFNIAYADGRSVENGRYATNADGVFNINGITGAVVVTEVQTAAGYSMNPASAVQTVTVNPDETQTLTFYDIPDQTLTVQLYARGTTDPIPGARFLLTDGTGAKLGNEDGEFTTDENGRFIVNGIAPGVTVSVKQTSTADGFLFDATPRTITIRSGEAQSVTVYNDPAQTLTVRLYQKGTTIPIPGAVFTVRDSGGSLIGTNNGEFTTDRNGEFTITGLTPGVTITATQTATVSGYVLDTAPQSILIRSGEAQTLTFTNALKGMLTVRKLDSVTEEPLKDAEFRISTVQGIPVDDHEGTTSANGLYTTDAQGEITLFKLDPGIYTVTETKAPDGYAIDRTPQTVEVRENDSQTLTFRDTALQSLTIVKYEEGTTNPIAGVTFSVTDANGNPVGAGTYTTDANGQITIPGLTPGMTVIVRETRTVRGYVLNGEPQTIVIGNGGNAVTSGTTGASGTAAGTVTGGNALVFFDEPLSTLIIHKFVEGTDNQPLAGVEFSIVDGRGAAVGNGTYYTDASGEIRVENLQPGMTVTVREIKTVRGYVLDGTPKSATIPSGDVLEMVFWNSRAGNLVILKQDSETRQPLPGVEFSIHYADGTPVADENGQTSSEGQYFTDGNGEIRINGIVGTVIVTEENTIPGYTIDPNARTKTVTVEPNDTQTLTFFNSPKQTLVVQKYASGTTDPIEGAAFYITDSKGAVLGQDGGEFVTDANGRIVLSDLTPGITVTARETRAASGYALETTPKSIAIQRGGVQTLTFFNDPVQTVRIRKYVQGTTTPIPGVTFILTDGTGAAIGSGEYTTNDNGEIVLNNIAPGTVINAREVRTATGYALNGRPQTLTVQNGENNVLTFYDEPLTTLIIRKFVEGSDNQPIPGTEFKVTDGTGAAIGPENGIYWTDGQGEIRIPNLQPGQTVTARETKAADGFVLDGTPQTIQIRSGEAQSMTFWNTPTQTLTVYKKAEGTEAPIPGTAFYITDQNAKPLGNANGEFTTDADGKIVLTGLTPGDSITVVETKAANGYVLDSTPKSVVIRSGEAQTLNVYNKPLGTLMIVKRDKATNAPLKDAEFQILTADGKFVPNAGGQLSSNGLYKTDDKGQIIITGLDTDTLVVRETKAPEGYLLDDQPQTVKVDPGDTQTLTFYNQAEKVLTIQKYESGTTKPIQGVVFLITDSTGATVGPDQGEYTTDRNGRIVLTGLTPGTTITAKEIRTAEGFVLDPTPQSILIRTGEAQTLRIYNKRAGGLELIKVDAADRTKRLPNTTFEIRAMDGGLVKKITTGRDGRIYTALDAGDYCLVEIEAAEGYKVDPTPEYFTVRDGKTTTLTVTNTAQSGILLHKTDAATGKGLYNVTFLLYNSRNAPIGQYTTDNMGYIRIVDLTAGQYFLRELENKGYVPDTQMKTVYVKSGETTLVEWKNIPITAQIQITKKSADYNPTNGLPAGTLLEGAVFQIYDKAGNVADTIQTDSRGVANSKPLPLDRYTFREVTAPANYGVNETIFNAYLEHAGEIARFEVTDKSLITGVSINKTGPKEAMPGQPVNYRFDHIANTSNVRLDTFYWRDTIPAQLRLQKVVTGTYNFPGSYKITYRVNGGEAKTLADNLSTSRNYTLDASPTALGLASNEYVSEIMFVFGQAPAGFAQVEAPALQCVLIPNVLANSFANVADVGGEYNGQWIQGVTRWTTTVYRKPGKLPRTGY